MKHAIEVDRAGHWPQSDAVGSVTLDYEMRQRRRVRLECDSTGPVLLDLKRPAGLRPGDGLRLAEGGWLTIEAAKEDLIEVTTSDPLSLQKLAWHLGNRHCPAEIHVDIIYIRRDHVLEQMIHGLGGHTKRVMRPFHPEGGAYDGQSHDHD